MVVGERQTFQEGDPMAGACLSRDDCLISGPLYQWTFSRYQCARDNHDSAWISFCESLRSRQSGGMECVQVSRWRALSNGRPGQADSCRKPRRGRVVAVARVSKITASSKKSFQDATEEACSAQPKPCAASPASRFCPSRGRSRTARSLSRDAGSHLHPGMMHRVRFTQH